MGEIITISMNKGGVGKTSLVTNLAGAITRGLKKKVLIIDTDGQGNSSIALGLNPNNFENTVYNVLIGNKSIKDVIVQVSPELHIVPSNDDMNFLEFDILPNLKQHRNPFKLLENGLEGVQDSYDYIFIDTPPSMGLVMGNVLNVTDKVIIPFVPEMFGVKGLIRIIEAIEEFKVRDNPNLSIAGVVGMMVDSRTSLHSEMLQQARKYCIENNIRMFDTIVPKSIRFANSTFYEGKPATWTDYNNPIVKSYYELLNEVFEDGK